MRLIFQSHGGRMTLELDEIRRLAVEIVHDENHAVDVVGVLTESGGSGYTEVLISLRGCAPEECRISVGIDRHVNEIAFRATLADKIRAHLQDHGLTSGSVF
jgi:hypothetical protein